MTFEVRLINFPEDLSKVDDFVFNIFLPDMPLIHLFNIDTNPALPRLPSPHEPTPHSQDIYLKAVDSKGEIIGIAVSKEHVVFATDSNTPKEWLQMVEFFEFIEDKSEINNLPGRPIELLILSVRPDWRKHGVAKRLAQESMVLARAAGFTTMKVSCGNEYTAKLARRLGWREHYRIPYKDYSKLSGANVTLTPISPHEYMYYYVTEL